ncbi:nucleoside/nucleotide kinase family protein [Cellulomonas sp. KRMCY2]|uniref:nucleoside/nucleotide kinase family protein n=1 Tax=Cellulomonas sp. KRMCY2 TaxID=1304865 RepID=UPI0004A27267|nr:nucleoside/nucleotide kinase family protein [Cellulomonas sp. KRMCY2]
MHPEPDDAAAVSLRVGELVRRAEWLVDQRPRTILGIVGAPGSGKSTLCQALSAALGTRAVIVGMDGFHLADPVLEDLGRRDRKGAPDTFDVAGYVALLDRLRGAQDDVVYAPEFDRSLEAAIAGAVPVPAAVQLVITEGNYLLHAADGWSSVRARLDEVWFLDVPPAERIRRLVARRLSFGDPEPAARAWVLGVDEANAVVVEAGRDAADLVVQLHTEPPGGPTAIA